MTNFLYLMKQKASAKAKEMAAIELKNWDIKHENELKAHFGFTDKKLSDRKIKLINSL